MIVRKDAAVTVCCFHRRPVKDEDGEKQTYPACKRRTPILKCADQHAGQMSDVLESGSFEIVLIDDVSRKGAKTQSHA